MGAFTMPSLGADMDRGTVVEWRVEPGDHVERGDIVAVVDTDKSTVEVEVFESGSVQEILVPVGEEVEVGTPLALIGTGPVEPTPPTAAPEAEERPAGELIGPHNHVVSPIVRHMAEQLGVDTDVLEPSGPGAVVTRSDVEAAARRSAPPSLPSPPLPPSPPPTPSAGVSASPGGGRVRASPYARRRAASLGLALAELHGTGPGGAVLARDVVAGPTPTRRGAAAARASVAALMARSKREVPHYYLRTTVDLGPVRAWLDLANADRSPADRIVPAAVVMWAVTRAAAANPGLNGHWVDGGFRPASGVQLGVAVSLRDGGLLAPVIPEADTLDAPELMRRLRDVTERARHGGLKASEMTDPSITVTNLGDTGVEEVYGVIYPPQVAMVGLGKVLDRPWAVDGRVEVRPVVTITLSGDHRATNGHQGARFLATIDRLLHDPEEPWSAPTPPTSS